MRRQVYCRKWARLPATVPHCPPEGHRREQLYLHATPPAEASSTVFNFSGNRAGPPPTYPPGAPEQSTSVVPPPSVLEVAPTGQNAKPAPATASAMVNLGKLRWSSRLQGR
ncbi:hypothetical protein AXF42_Ash017938 [Apostasia shenzhenica]|uniref:Uncharacterized protein n=1 Tax=Apostasia shenzhenica TaxID=1088818 RepID=A0A2I0AYA6_9ASPA|nr:hypothetical protein AXF42_Ash017938 [Apostasia shenzhenica]